MNFTTVTDITTILKDERTLFPYFKDRYALMLLADYVGRGMDVPTVRQSRYGRLLEKPLVKSVLARCGGGRLTRDRLVSEWPEQPQVYVITFGRWGTLFKHRWDRSTHQTCRRGFNLVVQLNFSMQHDRLFRALSEYDTSLNSSGHPVNDKTRFTLAWARIDFDLDDGEALIEEVQSDWAAWADSEIKSHRREIYAKNRYRCIDFEGRPRLEYELLCEYERVWKAHAKIWDQAVLAAAIWFLREELDIRRIFYHTFETEVHMKEFDGEWAPPKSLYTRLPRRFCFERTREVPQFVRRSADGYVGYQLNRRELEWFLLEA